jgi:hypothetical protein
MEGLMTRFVVALVLVASLLSSVNDVLTFLTSLEEPGPVLAHAMATLLERTAPLVPCAGALER